MKIEQAMRTADETASAQSGECKRVADRFDQIASYLADLDLDTIWREAMEVERRALSDELIEGVHVRPDHLTVIVRGAPALNVTLAEVGLNANGEFQSCRRGDSYLTPRAPAAGEFLVAA